MQVLIKAGKDKKTSERKRRRRLSLRMVGSDDREMDDDSDDSWVAQCCNPLTLSGREAKKNGVAQCYICQQGAAGGRLAFCGLPVN